MRNDIRRFPYLPSWGWAPSSPDEQYEEFQEKGWFWLYAGSEENILLTHGRPSGEVAAPPRVVQQADLLLCCYPREVAEATGKPTVGNWKIGNLQFTDEALVVWDSERVTPWGAGNSPSGDSFDLP